MANGRDNTVSILLGNGDGTFQQPARTFPVAPTTGTWAQRIAVGNFDTRMGRTTLDLAVTRNDNTVAVLPGNGDGTFGPAVAYPASCCSGPVVVSDFNRDGNLDLAVGNPIVSILLGNGAGAFLPAQNFGSFDFDGAADMTAGDFNGDGNPDVALVNGRSTPGGRLYVLLFGTSNPNLNVTWKKDYIYTNGQLTATVEKP